MGTTYPCPVASEADLAPPETFRSLKWAGCSDSYWPVPVHGGEKKQEEEKKRKKCRYSESDIQDRRTQGVEIRSSKRQRDKKQAVSL